MLPSVRKRNNRMAMIRGTLAILKQRTKKGRASGVLKSTLVQEPFRASDVYDMNGESTQSRFMVEL